MTFTEPAPLVWMDHSHGVPRVVASVHGPSDEGLRGRDPRVDALDNVHLRLTREGALRLSEALRKAADGLAAWDAAEREIAARRDELNPWFARRSEAC